MASAAIEALGTWGKFLRGEIPNPGKFEQHLLVMENLASIRGRQFPPNINRYAMRSIEMDVGSTDDLGFTFVKMGPIAILGFFFLTKPREWSVGKVHVNHGIVGPTNYKVPEAFLEYLVRRAVRYGDLMSQLSERQRTIADKATTEGIERNKEKLVSSSWMKAMQRDVDQFGDDAFDAGFPKK